MEPDAPSGNKLSQLFTMIGVRNDDCRTVDEMLAVNSPQLLVLPAVFTDRAWVSSTAASAAREALTEVCPS